MDGSNFPSNDGIIKQSTKNAHRVIENKKELVEFYADWIIQGISFTFTISILYLVYVLFEKESKEKDAQIKLLTKQKMNRIKGLRFYKFCCESFYHIDSVLRVFLVQKVCTGAFFM